MSLTHRSVITDTLSAATKHAVPTTILYNCANTEESRLYFTDLVMGCAKDILHSSHQPPHISATSFNLNKLPLHSVFDSEEGGGQQFTPLLADAAFTNTEALGQLQQFLANPHNDYPGVKVTFTAKTLVPCTLLDKLHKYSAGKRLVWSTTIALLSFTHYSTMADLCLWLGAETQTPLDTQLDGHQLFFFDGGKVQQEMCDAATKRWRLAPQCPVAELILCSVKERESAQRHKGTRRAVEDRCNFLQRCLDEQVDERREVSSLCTESKKEAQLAVAKAARAEKDTARAMQLTNSIFKSMKEQADANRDQIQKLESSWATAKTLQAHLQKTMSKTAPSSKEDGQPSG